MSRALRDKGTDPISEWNDAARLQVNQLLNLLKLTRARLLFTHESFQFQPVQMPIIINPSPSSFPLPRLRLRNEEVGRDTQRIVPQINSLRRGELLSPLEPAARISGHCSNTEFLEPDWTEPGPTTPTWTRQKGFRILPTYILSLIHI